MKHLTWVVLLGLLVALSGCGVKDTTPANPTPVPAASEHGKLPKRTPGGQK
jgi:hypothetical protein